MYVMVSAYTDKNTEIDEIVCLGFICPYIYESVYLHIMIVVYLTMRKIKITLLDKNKTDSEKTEPFFYYCYKS